MKYIFLALTFLIVSTSCIESSNSENLNVKKSMKVLNKEDSISLKLKEIDSLIKSNEKVIEQLNE